MTNRFKYPTYWASGGTAVDPDLDTTNPNYVPDKYETEGWSSQKPPEDWQNFLQQISDVKIIELLAYGTAEFDASVSYKSMGITKVGNVFYLNYGTTDTSADPTLGNPWKPVLSVSGPDYEAFVTGLSLKINNHLGADNPHKDTITGIGGYPKSDVFTALDSETNPLNIKYHTARVGRVHSETPVQVGTLPTSGGTFTGDVTLAAKIAFNAGQTSVVWVNPATGSIELTFGAYSLSVDFDGNSWFTVNGVLSSVITEDNFDSVQTKLNGQFALPAKLYSINVKRNLNDGGSIGSWTISTVNVPVFNPDIGLRFDNNAATLSGVVLGVASSCHIVAGKGTVRSIGIVNLSSGFVISDVAALVNRISAGHTHLAYIDIYPTLTPYQISKLVK